MKKRINRILILNNSIKPCGVQQWGARLINVVNKSTTYEYLYREVSSSGETISAIVDINPSIVLYNYNPSTMPFIKKNILGMFPNIKHVAMVHEGYLHTDNFVGFKYFIYLLGKFDGLDPEILNRVFVLPIRYLLKYDGGYPVNKVPTIGSFGFGFPSKRFDYIVDQVNKEFDVADIKFAISNSYHGDRDGSSAEAVIKTCREKITKPGINLYVNREFLTDEEVLEFLAGNDINCFFYDTRKTDAVASSTEFALSVKRPMAITRVSMFYNIYTIVPSICIEDTSIKDILERGTEPLEPLYKAFSDENFLFEFEKIIKVING